MSDNKEAVSEQTLAKAAKKEQLERFDHQAEQITESVERLLEACKRDDGKRTAYWGGVAARQLSELIREALEATPCQKKIIT